MFKSFVTYWKQAFCLHEYLYMWNYIGEKYTFRCDKCSRFFHVDNRDPFMDKTYRKLKPDEIVNVND